MISMSIGDKLTDSTSGPGGDGAAGQERGSPGTTRVRPPARAAEVSPVMAERNVDHLSPTQPELCDLGQAPESPEPPKAPRILGTLNSQSAQDRTLNGLKRSHGEAGKDYLGS